MGNNITTEYLCMWMKINHLIYSFCWMWQLALSRLTTIEWNYMPFIDFGVVFEYEYFNELNEKFEDNEKEKNKKKKWKAKRCSEKNYIHCDVLFWIGAFILFKFSTHCKRVLINKKGYQRAETHQFFFVS